MAKIILKNGGFSKITGLKFRDFMEQNGKLIGNLCEVQESQNPDKSGSITPEKTASKEDIQVSLDLRLLKIFTDPAK